MEDKGGIIINSVNSLDGFLVSIVDRLVVVNQELHNHVILNYRMFDILEEIKLLLHRDINGDAENHIE